MIDSIKGSDGAPATHGTREFKTTHWSLVVQAGGKGKDGDARGALEELCQTYWRPLYGYARRRGHAEEEAKDLTQGFFAQLLAEDAIARADAARGRFRTFLLAMFDHYRAHEYARATRQKRGGGCEVISLDALAAAEARFQEEPATADSPEKIFDRKWAVNLLEQTLEAVQHEYAAADKVALFAALREVLWGGRGEIRYATIAERLETTDGAIKVAVMRLRQRFREQVRHEVAKTLVRSEDADDELRHLCGTGRVTWAVIRARIPNDRRPLAA
jgi:RNA polymerase sigma-70 factor (ECF subfamily)